VEFGVGVEFVAGSTARHPIEHVAYVKEEQCTGGLGGVEEAFILSEGKVTEVVNAPRDANAHLTFREEMGRKVGSKMDCDGSTKDVPVGSAGADADGAEFVRAVRVFVEGDDFQIISKLNLAVLPKVI
jgi:hypothetical protein